MKCRHVKADGAPCGVDVPAGTELCVWHDPTKREQARDARRKGAEMANRRNRKARTVMPEEAPPPPETIEDVARWGSWLTWAVAVGKIDARTAHEAAYALRTFLDGRKHLDRTDERVKELGEKLRKLQAT